MANDENIYSLPLDEARGLFGDYLDGAADGIALVVSVGRLPDAARTALDSSLVRLGWGACTFLSWPEGLEDAGALFMAVEGIDPCVLIVADARAAKLCEAAFHRPVSFGPAFRLNCRDCCAFEDFAAQLDSSDHKQRAWAELKTLPRRK